MQMIFIAVMLSNLNFDLFDQKHIKKKIPKTQETCIPKKNMKTYIFPKTHENMFSKIKKLILEPMKIMFSRKITLKFMFKLFNKCSPIPMAFLFFDQVELKLLMTKFDF